MQPFCYGDTHLQLIVLFDLRDAENTGQRNFILFENRIGERPVLGAALVPARINHITLRVLHAGLAVDFEYLCLGATTQESTHESIQQ